MAMCCTVEIIRQSDLPEENLPNVALGRRRIVVDRPIHLSQNAPQHSQFLGIWFGPVQQLPQFGHATGGSMGVKITDLEQNRL
jgi:hypothetical protein